jgi:two-component system, chemotaxis family, chemotaxis protein CheY
MKALIVEDDFTSRLLLQSILDPCGECHIAADGIEAIEAFMLAWSEGCRYDLICLDIMMPRMDGQEVLKRIRTMEEAEGIQPGNGVKIVMATGLKDKGSVFAAFNGQCDGYLVKPVNKADVYAQLRDFGLI